MHSKKKQRPEEVQVHIPEPFPEITDADVELEALDAIVASLAPLDKEAQVRVAEYLISRYGRSVKE